MSYRRSDAGGWAGRVHERLVHALGAERVFMDIASIEPGEHWQDRLRQELQASELVLVLIGPDWAGVRPDGTRRLDDEDDPVRVEVGIALAATRPLVPVLVGGARMPEVDTLPAALVPMLDANAVLLEPSYFDHGIDRLVRHAGGDARRRRRAIGAGGALLVAAAAIAGVLAMRGENRTEPMTGDFNVAVVPFTVLRDGEPVDPSGGGHFADDIATQLDGELERLRSAGFQPEVRHPAELQALTGSTPQERSEQAARLADSLAADLVVFGVVEVSGDGSQLEPEFYLDDRRLFDAAELSGGYVLGRPFESAVDITVNAVAARQARQDLSDRSAGFVDLVFGLGYYSVRDYTTAEALFRRADEEFDDGKGREVVLLFLGDSMGRQRRFDEAIAAYDEALGFAPGYARLPLSVAEARFQQVAGDSGCQPGAVDVGGLDDVTASYEAARSAPTQPPLADVALRAGFGLARVELCRVNAGLAADRSQVDQLLADVTGEYEAGNTRITEVAAEAYGFQALALLTGPDGATETVKRAAAERYGLAAATALDEQRRGEFERLREQVMSAE